MIEDEDKHNYCLNSVRGKNGENCCFCTIECTSQNNRDKLNNRSIFVYDLPCLHLQKIESLAMRNDLPTRIHASGVVTTFKQRNYLLLSLWRPGLSSRNVVR